MPSNTSLRRLLASASLIAACMSGVPALAQTSNETADKRLAPVTVTATRVEENLQDVPVSISTLSGEKPIP